MTIELVMDENIDIIIPDNFSDHINSMIESKAVFEPNCPSTNISIPQDTIETIAIIHSPQSPVLLANPQENARLQL